MLKKGISIAMLCAICLPVQAMKEYDLKCPERGVMTVLHTNYLISTLKWGSRFIVSHPAISYNEHNVNYKIYNFLNGNSLVKKAGDHKRYYFIYKDGEKVECTKIGEAELEITKLPIVHNVG
ncbi:hypothetical protein [Providencia stuartii]|uniref:hypothetical protein n=1 Tax=Providencia stuartii TaxID=588 RepID=UPI003D7FD971